MCIVANNKPSSDSANISLGGLLLTHPICSYITHGGLLSAAASLPTDLTAVQDGPTSIRVSWAPPSPWGDTSGYRIYYTRGGGSGGNTNTYILTGLTNGETYTLSIVGTSLSATVLPSEPLSTWFPLGIHYNLVEFTLSLSQFHQLQSSVSLQQSLPLPSESLALFPVAQ